ncbi:hypothetical protein ACQKWADRAFT_74281 [Trichoderma austrokoningii]
MATSTVELHALTSASLGPDDSITLYENPYTALEKLQDAGKGREIESLGHVNGVVVDWREYEPPAALRKAPTIKSQILLDIIFSSIENVRSRVEEEKRLQKEAAEEAERRTAEERQKAKGKEPYLPIIIPTEASPSTVAPSTPSNFIMSGGNGLPAKAEKRGLFRLRNIFQRSPEGGESSAAGWSREALRHKLEIKILSFEAESADSKTQEAIAALRKSKIFKMVDPDELVECVSCLDDFPAKDMVKVPCHSYCRDCLARLVAAAVQFEQHWPPKCCLNQIPFETVLRNIPEDLKKTFHERSSEWEIPISERVYCHAPECGVWIKPSKISLAKRQGRCERNHTTCTICRGQEHGNYDCPQDHDLNLTNLLAEEEGWKHCISCRALVEHKDACQHMTCRCGAEFCYVCGLRWRSCECTMEQLDAIKEAAEDRRKQRLLNEEADAEELRDILAEIEEYERQEALKAVAESLEQERLEQERWRAVVEERLRLEDVRRQEVEIKYRQLRDMLDDLHGLQRVMASSKQEDDARDLATNAELEKKRLEEEHQVEREALGSSMQVRLKAKEDHYEKEYATRADFERRLEHDYLKQLRDFWSGKVGAEEKIEASMQPLRQRMDAAYQSWQRWRDDQLAYYRDRLEDERMVMEEFIYSSRKRMDAACLAKEAELARRIVAEKEWLREVMLERERLLSAMEIKETEDDADSLYGVELNW